MTDDHTDLFCLSSGGHLFKMGLPGTELPRVQGCAPLGGSGRGGSGEALAFASCAAAVVLGS